MNIWWIVAWDHYYPSRKLDNVKGTFSSKQEALDSATYRTCMSDYDFLEIVNVNDLLFPETPKS
jgi:hypothetical protein